MAQSTEPQTLAFPHVERRLPCGAKGMVHFALQELRALQSCWRRDSRWPGEAVGDWAVGTAAGLLLSVLALVKLKSNWLWTSAALVARVLR